MNLPPQYNPKKTEEKIYKIWESSGFFNPDNLPGDRKKTFVSPLPPPNITGSLHMGHALNAACQDIIIRKKRMEGYKALWIPGTDHAGIATQNVVEKELKKESLTRHELGKEKFIAAIWEWKNKYGNIILEQLKKLGASCDWSRTVFTMDEKYKKAVEAAFLHYYNKGYIYQGERVINWCSRCATSLSDLELEYKEEKGNLYFIKYPIAQNLKSEIRNPKQIQNHKIKNQKYITVATTRPETMLGDTAVAAHPDDARYKNFIGGQAILPIQNREIPIISDQTIDPSFGTGAVKVTPTHSIADFEISERHNLPRVKIIDERGKMTKESKICEGLTVEECRTKIIENLAADGYLEKIESIVHNISHCYRCGKIIEQILSKQWFLKMKELAKIAIEGARSGKIAFTPKNFEKMYFDWLENIRDWCISRQIWWGHKIPLEGVDDVLDTWFSSALWPFATLGWPEKTKDLEIYYPANLLVTARDIINLWVGRMIFSGKELIKEYPFTQVYIHPTVLTKDGKRMSKSLGTGIDPLTLIEKYGADATRFGLVWQNMGGQDLRFSEEHCLAGKKFANKLWNIARFILSRDENSFDDIINKKSVSGENNVKIIKELKAIQQKINSSLEIFQFGQALNALYEFTWHEFADKYIEYAKTQTSKETQQTLAQTLIIILKLLHPFMPFITEEIWSYLPIKDKKLLMIEEWPN